MRALASWVLLALVTGCQTAPAIIARAPASSVAPAREPTVWEPVVQPIPLGDPNVWHSAVNHTNAGKQRLVDATDAKAEEEAVRALQLALAEYRLAVEDWQKFVATDGSDAGYEGAFWLAVASEKVVVIGQVLQAHSGSPPPSQSEIDQAREAAIGVRDWIGEDSRHAVVAARLVVDGCDVAVQLDDELFIRSNQSQGYPKLTQLQTVGFGQNMQVVRVPIPPNLQSALDARDRYAAMVHPSEDTIDAKGVTHAVMLQFEAADVYFVYGDFANAAKRFGPVYESQCGKNEYGQKAWVKLISMAAKSNDFVRARELAERDKRYSCAMRP